MNEEYNKNNMDMENKQEDQQEPNFVMEASQKETQEQQEPGKAPTPENPYYAFSYKKEASEEKKEEPKRETHNAYHFMPQVPPEPAAKKKTKKSQPGGIGRKLAVSAATAAVFGLVAGVVFQSVNYVGRMLEPEEPQQIENTITTQENNAALQGVSTENKSAGNVAEVAKNAMPSIVAITSVSIQEIPNYFGFGTQQYETPGSGSGIIVGQNDTELLIATNNHVVQDANTITVCFTNQDGTAATPSVVENTSTDAENVDNAVSAQIKGTDADNDLAVVAVKIEDIPEDILSEIKVAVIGDSDSLEVGEQVVAIGNALGYGQSVTSGYVSALNKQISTEAANSTFIQTDAAINPGNSGGALLNMNGELIGINSAKVAVEEVEGMGFAIPISQAEPILDDLMSRETRSKVEDESKAAYLGITCKNVTTDASQMYNMPVGVFVDTVVEDGPAAAAGIQAGDIIRKMDGTTVETYDALIDRLTYYEAGEEIEFLVSRAEGGSYEEKTVTIKLGTRPETSSNSNNNSNNSNRSGFGR